MKTRCRFSLLTAMLAIMLVLSLSFAAIAAEQPVLVVTGTDLVSGATAADLTENIANEKAYTLEELKALGITKEAVYSAINTSSTKSVYKAEGVDVAALLALLNYAGDGNIAAIAGDGYDATLNLNDVRYYHPNFVNDDAAGAVEVPVMLTWATGGKRGNLEVPATVEALEELMLIAGQLNVTDMNNPLFNKGVVKILAGEELPAVLTVDGKAYTRAEILLMPRTEATYTYTNSSGEQNDTVKGVLLADLIGDAIADNAVLSFACADGYAVKSSLTYAELKAANYMLAYEKAGEAVYEAEKGGGPARGYFTLYGDDFKPSKMISTITSAAGSEPVAPTPVAPVDPSPVDPVAPSEPAGEWYDDAVAYVTEAGLMNGTDKGFEPDALASRATVVSILSRLSSSDFADGTYANKFDDVAYNAWYVSPVAWAADKGIAQGYTDFWFGPDDAVTREQLLVMLANYLNVYGIELPATTDVPAFTDADKISDWAVEAVETICAIGLVGGYPDGSFKPQQEAKRSDLAAFIMRFDEAVNAALAAGAADQPILLVTGSGIAALDETIVNEKSYTIEDLKALGLTAQQIYSAVNSSGTKSIYLAEGVYLADLLAALNYDGTSTITAIAADGYAPKVNYSDARYYYPNLASDSVDGAVEVEALIAWATGGERGKTDVPTAVVEEEALTMYVGQLAIDDKNNSKFTTGLATIKVGDDLEAVINIAGKDYTRAEIIMMPRTEGTYTYQTKGGETTAVVRGVAFADLLAGYGDADTVSFTAADGYDMSAVTCTVAEARKNYLLAYEKQDENGNWVGIFDKAKSGDGVGFFTLYIKDGKPSSLIDSISVTAASGIDYAKSPFRHINNGGHIGSSPYNIDAITGSTLTVEGPGMTKSVPLSIREVENQNAGTVRKAYTDVNGELLYEGIDLYHILYGMTSGDNGIVTTDKAYKVTLKNRNRVNIAEFTLEQIKAAHEAGNPILVAYGTGFVDGSAAAPFVFDDAVGSIPGLYNEDGCIKLVYDHAAVEGDLNPDYDKFLSMAYIYVSEEFTPGFKHNVAPYDDPDMSQYILTIAGEEIGREINLTVDQIEALVEYDAQGNLVPGSLGHRDLYSLTNTTYWYVNEYEGIKLYELLKYLGLDPEADMATQVTFNAYDGYKSADSFTLAELSNPDLFGYYEKAAEDINDGKYVSDADDLLRTGFPVLLCYGVNGYPYTLNTSNEGYLSGLSNDGGPFRIIFGKREYSHVNGSNQIQKVQEVLVGADTYEYSSHKYSDKAVFNALVDEKLTVTVKGDDGTLLKDNVVFTVGQLEDLVYGEVTAQAANAAQNKAYYEFEKGGEQYSDLYEGIDLNYFLTKVIEIPGIKGTITFTNAEGEELVVSIEEALALGKNEQSGVDGLGATIAYAKNGTPLVYDKKSEGFEKKFEVADGISLTVQNSGGPLALLIPATEGREAMSLGNLVAIDVNLEADKYAHLSGAYEALGAATLTVSGSGTTLTDAKVFTVADLEGKQTIAKTAVYSFLNKKGKVSEARYRGLDLYEFLRSTDVGLRSNAEKVIVTSTDNNVYEFTVSELMKRDYVNTVSGAADLTIMLAYGSAAADNADAEDGLPLVAEDTDAGYVEAYDNAGGPLMLIIPQVDAEDVNRSKCVKQVASIEVTASALDSWKHSVSDIYAAYNDFEFTFEVKNSDGSASWSKVYKLSELEAMEAVIVRDDYVWVGQHAHEGLMIWAFIMQEAGNIVGIDNPSAITAFAKDGYSKEFISIWGLEEVQNGVKDSATGNRKHIILAYSQDGLPLVPSEGDEGYSGLAGNGYGPIRVIAHENQGACNKNVNKLVVTLNGTDPISFK
ncbi:MAG: S-layer homology domain-containing protein [Firmicutes bacterium]|nr:S-layer homology domain-containing protein [Bacillota bacterium]